MEAILERYGQDFLRADPVSSETLQHIEARTGIALDEDVRAFFTYSNGSQNETCAAVISDELTPLAFPTLEDALDAWSWFEPYDAAVYEEWDDPDATERNPRIQPAHLHHRLWFPLAEFNGYSTSVYFDADPTPQGVPGQIIVYQHDPDGVYYVAESFLAFLTASNDLLEARGAELFD
jgi:cell wall assembly regulator SMI1